MKTPREVVQDRVAAYNQRDDYAAAESYHEDATNLQVALGNLIVRVPSQSAFLFISHTRYCAIRS